MMSAPINAWQRRFKIFFRTLISTRIWSINIQEVCVHVRTCKELMLTPISKTSTDQYRCMAWFPCSKKREADGRTDGLTDWLTDWLTDALFLAANDDTQAKQSSTEAAAAAAAADWKSSISTFVMIPCSSSSSSSSSARLYDFSHERILVSPEIDLVPAIAAWENDFRYVARAARKWN
jgi:hypothetical protein